MLLFSEFHFNLSAGDRGPHNNPTRKFIKSNLPINLICVSTYRKKFTQTNEKSFRFALSRQIIYHFQVSRSKRLSLQFKCTCYERLKRAFIIYCLTVPFITFDLPLDNYCLMRNATDKKSKLRESEK